MDKLLNQYEEAFGECFPLMLCRGMDEGDIEAIVEGCIIAGEPYEVMDDNDY